MDLKFSKLLKGITRAFSKKGAFYRLGENPVADWLLVLGVFVLLSVALVLLTLTHYKAIENSPLSSSNNASTTAGLFEVGQIERTMDHYESRKKDFVKLQEMPAVIVDPSK